MQINKISTDFQQQSVTGEDDMTVQKSMNLRHQEMLRKFIITSSEDDYAFPGPTEPRNYKEAMSSLSSGNWSKAIVDELENMKKYKVWEIVDRSQATSIISAGWVFKVKENADGSLERHKARLVARGCAQIFGRDYSQTFAPTLRYEALRILVALAAQLRLNMHQTDVLAGDLEEDVYLRIPEGLDEDRRKKR